MAAATTSTSPFIRTQENAYHVDSGKGEHIYEMAGPENGDLKGYSVAYVEIEPGKSTQTHYHPNPVFEETYTIIEGTGQMLLEKDTFDVKPVTTVVIKSGVDHKITNLGKETLKMVVVCTPPWTMECGVYKA